MNLGRYFQSMTPSSSTSIGRLFLTLVVDWSSRHRDAPGRDVSRLQPVTGRAKRVKAWAESEYNSERCWFAIVSVLKVMLLKGLRSLQRFISLFCKKTKKNVKRYFVQSYKCIVYSLYLQHFAFLSFNSSVRHFIKRRRRQRKESVPKQRNIIFPVCLRFSLSYFDRFTFKYLVNDLTAFSKLKNNIYFGA